MLTVLAIHSSLQRLIRAVDGTVAQLRAHTVVEAAKPIIAIVPSGGSLIAEVQVLNKDTAFVHAGQPVAIRLKAFPFTRYGTVPGRIQSISSDAVEDEKLGFVYTAKIVLTRATIARDGVVARLSPGMATTADIRTG